MISRLIRPIPFFALLLIGAVVSCQRQVPPAPEITVVITVVDDQQALDVAVNDALAETEQANIYITETVLALGGMTLTPTRTPTNTPIPPTPTETPYLSPTPTATATASPSPTFLPLPSITPPSTPPPQSNGRIRVLHAWQAADATPLDVLIDDLPVATGLSLGESTPYQSVLANSVRISLRQPIPAQPENIAETTPQPPLLSRVVDVPAGGGVSVVIVDLGEGLAMIPVNENLEPIATSKSRLTILQANPDLLRSNLILPDQEAALAYNLDVGQIPGPFDLTSDTYSITFFDADSPEIFLGRVDNLELDSRLNYLMVLLPALSDDELFTDYHLFPSTTRRTPTDTAVHFVNAATNTGAVTIVLDGVVQVNSLLVGETTIPIPVSALGQNIEIRNETGERLNLIETIGPWQDTSVDQIILISDDPQSTRYPIRLSAFSQSERPSAVRSNIRLIHALTGTTREIDLEIRSTTPEMIQNDFGIPQSQQGDTTWSPVIQGVEFENASEYEARNPNTFDVRAIINSTQNVLATIPNLQLLPGGVYDFVVLPGGSQGVAQLVLIQPDVQVTSLGINQADPQVIQEQVEAALTASAPAPGVSATPTSVGTATPTVSPVPTNTPRPSNTPDIQPPNLVVIPAPPETVTDSFLLFAENFMPNRRYTISIDDGPENLSGSIGNDGTLTLTVSLPSDIDPGLHTVRLCVDCRNDGASQERFALFRVASSNSTPTSTPER